MDASLWIAKTGLTAQQTRMQVISNNLANVNTTGFSNNFIYTANKLQFFMSKLAFYVSFK